MTFNSDNKNVEILCIGSELLLGSILNSNSKWIAEQLANIGLNHYRQSVIGDNSERLKQFILESSRRCNVLITTGGLGPTPDDLTTQSIADAFNVQLKENQEILIDIKQKLKDKQAIIPKNNFKQTLLPIGAEVIPNQTGTAPGMRWTPIPNFTILTFPGVPSEMKQMWIDEAGPWLQKQMGGEKVLTSKMMKMAGISESRLAEQIQEFLEFTNPTVAPYASIGEVKLRVTANSKTSNEGKELIKKVERDIRQKVGLQYYGNDNDSLASVVIDLLRKRGETLATAESCTGGGIGSTITAIPGASEVFLGGIIAYSNSIKEKLLDVDRSLLDVHGAVSTPVVEAMAKGAINNFKADWSIAVSGLAGPSGASIQKPIGMICFCVSYKNKSKSFTEKLGSYKNRLDIQQLSVVRGLDLLRLFLLEQN